MDKRNLGALVFDGRGKVRGGAGASSGASTDKPRAERRVPGGRLHVGHDALLDVRWKFAPPEDAHGAFESEVGIARLNRGRHLGGLRRTLTVGNENELGRAGLMMRQEERHAYCRDLEPSLVQILKGRCEV